LVAGEGACAWGELLHTRRDENRRTEGGEVGLQERDLCWQMPWLMYSSKTMIWFAILLYRALATNSCC